MNIERDKINKIVQIASRAPTAHNTQPAKWKIHSNGLVEIYADEHKKLIAADPSGWSFRLSIGTSIEGLALGANHEGLKLSEIQYVNETIPGDLYNNSYKLVGTAQLHKQEEPATKDDLLNYVDKRKSYRGCFSKFENQLSTHELEKVENLMLISDRKIIDETAELHLTATYEDMKKFSYSKELFHWVQFYPRAGQYRKSGFTARTLNLNWLEQIFGPVVLNPYVFKCLRYLGLGKLILSQKETDKSASHLAIILADKGTNPYECGRIFYRNWLKITKAGFYACPISTVVDCPETYQEFIKSVVIPEDKMLVDLLKIGPVNNEALVATSLRMDVSDLLLDD